MSKNWKRFLGLLLLPFCYGAGFALVQVIKGSGRADTVWVALTAGAACWVVIFLLLPKPLWIYVVGHELTHVLWTWIFGGKVKRFKATSRGGHVVVTRDNFLISLAPYFFPLYTVMTVLLFLAGDMVWGWSRARAWLHFCLGFTYAFHVTLTAHALRSRQTDLSAHGYFFSMVVIWLGNMAVLLLGLPLVLGRTGVLQAFSLVLTGAAQMVRTLGEIL